MVLYFLIIWCWRLDLDLFSKKSPFSHCEKILTLTQPWPSFITQIIVVFKILATGVCVWGGGGGQMFHFSPFWVDPVTLTLASRPFVLRAYERTVVELSFSASSTTVLIIVSEISTIMLSNTFFLYPGFELTYIFDQLVEPSFFHFKVTPQISAQSVQ